jgi:hypothetical protein
MQSIQQLFIGSVTHICALFPAKGTNARAETGRSLSRRPPLGWKLLGTVSLGLKTLSRPHHCLFRIRLKLQKNCFSN